MFRSDFIAKRFCLWTLIWSGFPGQARTDLLVIGTPPGRTVKSTITITTTITYKPSLVPGNSQYTLVGCYGQLHTDGGHIFGPDDYDVCLDKVASGNLTIDGCLRGCGSAAPPKNETETYVYAGLRNGSECRCGIQLPTGAHKLSADDCIAPCSGDPRLSCGGHDNIAVYSLISADGTHKQGSQSSLNPSNSSKSGPSTPTNSEAKKPTAIKPSVWSSTIDIKSTEPQTADSYETLPPSAGPGGPGKPVSTPTIAAITGSFSGAILIAAALFLCYRAHKRKKRVQDAHVKSMLERRGRQSIQSPMFPSPTIQNTVANTTAIRHERDSDEDSGGNGGSEIHNREKNLRLTVDGDLIPNTPALESGRKVPAGLHSRTTASAAGTRSGSGTAVSEERNTVYSALTGEARSGQASPHLHTQAAGASSAVQWRPSNAHSGMPSTQFTTHQHAASSNGIAAPQPSARVGGLGERAWHRRKLSMPYQQPPVESSRGSIARRGPPTGPPTGPLPLTPLPNPGVRARSRSRPGAMPDGPGDMKETGKFHPPPRPRRSFDTIVFEPELGDHEGLVGLGIVRGTGNASAVGMSHANASTPSLGRYGSISKSRPPNVESPVLGWQTGNGPSQWGMLPRETTGEPFADRQPRLPVLPPIAPGERFDHKRWRGTIYAESSDSIESVEQRERRRQQSRRDGLSPVSVSSTGTSILFGGEEFDRRL
ncbi:hypothetical protein E0Z10_g10596 [Xylaria hypoxylon]|uniref:WSC domain-containing protein n=1 Tax=Xylaria hypoxylon TaxID=37992 RepID=A0A4Z0YE20_9PEZI|nr:hypothetical protein E0Z10_g10596 [Xylaria hypoxylon]